MHDLRAGITTSTSHEFPLLNPQETWWITDIINFGSALAKFPGVSYLLETCKVSSYTMHRCAGLEKIELFRAPTRHFLDTTETIPDTLNYLYLRPSIDIFMVSIDSLVRLYRIGGSIGSLCNIQQLAITGMDYNLFDDCDDEEITTLFEKLCNIVEIHCLALEKLHLVIGDTETVPFGDVKDSLELTRDLRLIEIDDDFQDFDLEEDKERQENYELESLKEEMNNTSEYVQHAMMELRGYIEQTEMLSDSDVADYWRKMKVVPAAVGWLEGEKRPQPWFPALSSVLPCYDNGAPFDTYQGIVELFEGADS
ncbi:uncharacterized protein Bfra_011487 [Botrytis fragariae]|uniref:Uncharacterized protein n=1 Tax=Botrytis fragariae TaxID=1964551 RepID=A0A8H6AXT6_9HELO|nr:uncharacterized protein Bfra_011487 [Botrytis fragariae]KAF5875724.1 hypothetical protein Bfra_011487 [Botrytis fragariae]